MSDEQEVPAVVPGAAYVGVLRCLLRLKGHRPFDQREQALDLENVLIGA